MVARKRITSAQTRERNSRWGGGRSIASNGYMLILVGKEHHLADVRGYAYEHRLVAEEKIGRRLLPGEIVHHLDHNKQNNHPGNLDVKASHAEHFAEHRRPDSDRRMPDEPNPLIPCACSCGKVFTKFDTSGRRRLYVSGHNPQESPRLQQVEEAVLAGHATLNDLAALLPLSRPALACALSRLTQGGRIVRRHVGLYGPPGSLRLKRQEPIQCACGCGIVLLRYDGQGRERSYISGHNRSRRNRHVTK